MKYIWVVQYSSDGGCVKDFEVEAVCESEKAAKRYIRGKGSDYKTNYCYERWEVEEE